MSPTRPPAVIEVAPCELQGEALRLVFGHLKPEAQTALVTTLLAGSAAGTLPMSGLFLARRDENLVGAVWAQVQPGKTAALWPPRLTVDEDPQTARRLLTTANQFFARHDVRLAQTLLEDPNSADARLLAAGGYQHMADLIYLVATEAHFPHHEAASELEFEPYSAENHARLIAVMEATYAETLDCPRLNGVRDLQDVVVGYQATGVFDPEHWRIARHAGQDIGCVLLNDHPGADQFELVYMGLIPAARGQGWGVQLAKFAQYLTGLAGRPRLVLAVDSQNLPALAMYAAADFMSWDRRSAFLHIVEP